MTEKGKLYVVANAHLDTQWNWTIQDTIRDCVKSTLERNFKLMDKYPHYRMNFEGAFRYKLAKEYYPDLYEKLKGYIAEGRWNVAGSTWDAMDANVPSSEALMRQILYGNGFFEKEFGKKSTDIFLTDCFGFRYALPSIEAHMGLNGFSTQKLVWGVGSPVINEDGSVTKPMPNPKPQKGEDRDEYRKRLKPRVDLGKWIGPDGNYVIGSFLEGNYTYNFGEGGDERPVGEREEYLKAIEHNEKYAHKAVRSMYYGTGDYGGSCRESSAKMVDEAVSKQDGLYEVVSASTDQIFNELAKEEIDRLPAYDGELLIPHGSGALTSHTINKRWNRKNELLADSAERAAVMSAWLGSTEYPAERLLTAWQTFLWHQFHDDLPGTSIAAAYVFSYNDYVIALNMFANELAGAVGGIASSLDTDVDGIPVVVYNPVSYARNDVVCAELDIDAPFVRVFDGYGKEYPAQFVKKNGKTEVKFVANVKPVSCTVFSVVGSETKPEVSSSLRVTENTLENARYSVAIDENGDISSVFDKENNKEILSSPSRLEIGPDKSSNWPSWELVWDDALAVPDYVKDDVSVEIADNGPAVISLRIRRTHGSSVFVQTVSLTEGGQRVDVECEVQWFERHSNLRASFPLTVSNPKAVFDLGLGAIESGNTDSFPYYQHVVHQWADLTDDDGSYGVSILNNCKYGMDKPNDNTLRLTLIHTPLEGFMPESGQDWQDFGKNLFTYSISGHEGFRDNTTLEAAELNQPAIPFVSTKHKGESSELSFIEVSDPHVVVRCIKKEEKGNRIIIRLQETSGLGTECTVKLAGNITSLTETNGYEDEIAPFKFNGNSFTFKTGKYGVKTFAVTIEAPVKSAEAKKQIWLALPYNKKVTSTNAELGSGELFDGISIPSELYNEKLNVGGINFTLMPSTTGNAMICRGQKIRVPEGTDKLYILAAANGDRTAEFKVDKNTVIVPIQDYKENVGCWDMFCAGKSCLVKRDDIAVCYTHTHNNEGDRLYLFAYYFKYCLDVRGAKYVTVPEDENLIISAMTAVKENDCIVPAAPLFDRVEADSSPCHILTVYGPDGSVNSKDTYHEGQKVLVRALNYDRGYVFKGWKGDAINSDFGSAVVVTMPSSDTSVEIVGERLGNDILMNKPVTASAEFNEQETGDKAVDGNDTDKWCAASEDGVFTLDVDAGDVFKVGKWFVMHCGVHESSSWNTKDFSLEYKASETDEWKTADEVKDNTEDITLREFTPVEGRYFRLHITNPTQDRNRTTRIYMFQVFTCEE